MAMLMMLALQLMFPPKNPPGQQGDENAVAELDDQGDAGQAQNKDADKEEGGAEVDAAELSRNGVDSSVLIKSDIEIEEQVSGELADSAATNAWYSQRSLTSVRQMGDLITIGSLNESGTDRYLITLNPYGGTVRRIELNLRDPRSGDYKYRDLEWEGGYLGSLEAHDTADGVRVGVVGKGTPADLATGIGVQGGIQKGDLLVSLDGEKITSAEDFGVMMATSKAGRDVELDVMRAGQTIKFTTTLTTKPIELVRPEPGTLSPTAVFDESFLLKLYKPNPDPQLDWVEVDEAMTSSQWEVVSSDEHSVELQFQVSPAKLKNLGLKGPIYVRKKFSVPVLAEEEIQDRSQKSFDWDFDVEIVNESDTDQALGYELKGPTGTPSETWWYSQKTHGRNLAIFKIAGARDVIGSTSFNDFAFVGGPEIVKEALKDRPITKFFTDPFKTVKDPRHAEINWLAVDTLYFNVTLFPKKSADEKFLAYSAFADVNNSAASAIPDNVRAQKLVDCTFRLYKAVTAPANSSVKQPFEVFTGPKEPKVLETYGLERTRVFGWFWWCSKPLLAALHILHFLTFKISYVIPIIILTVFVRSLMIPFSRKAALNAQMMQYLQPQMKEIADKYSDDMEGRAKAQQDLFKKYNYKPLGGCLIGLIQLPVFIGLYRGLSVDIALRDEPIINGLSWASNLSGPDQFWYWKNLLPGWLDEAGWFGPFLNILPLVTMVLFLIQQKLFTPPAMDENQAVMQKAMSFAMLFMAIMFFKVPAGLCVYFVTSSIWGILERKLLPKPVLDTDSLDESDKGPSMKDRLAGKGMALLKGNKSDPQETALDGMEERKRLRKERKKKLKKK